ALLNTHTHYDHVALNDAFRRRGAEVVNMETTDIPGEGLWLGGAERRVLMRPMPHLHTPTDCIVWVPESRVLFTGDLFGWGLIPLTRALSSDSAGLLLETYSRLIEYDAQTVVPGHGPLCDTETLKRFAEYFVWLVEQTHQAVQAGKSNDEITRQVTPPEDMRHWWRFSEWKHDRSLRTVLRAVRNDRLGPDDVRTWRDAPPWK
ncbi:MAG: MBL fold metallo-hydrolase, partial [Planctomycetota bacterium]